MHHRTGLPPETETDQRSAAIVKPVGPAPLTGHGFATQALPPDEVTSFLHLIETLGSAAQMLFGRVYQGLGLRKQGGPETPQEDTTAVLRAANRDLLARARASETLSAQLKAVFASLHEGVIMQDTEGRILLINPAAEALIGSIKNFWDSDLGRLFTDARAKGSGDAEMELIGEPVRVQVNQIIVGAQLAAVFTGRERLGTILVLRDVTSEVLADRLKDEFVTAITHELRTPLTSIKGMSDILLGQPADRPPNRKFLEAIGRNAAILDRMIVELLDISEISSGAFEVRQGRVALDELVFDVIKGQEARISRNNLVVGLAIVNRGRVYALGDEQRLRWAIGHLLDNALNYTLKGGFISLRVGAIKGDKVLVEVQDTGVGIREKDLAHVFERFYRGEAKTPDGKLIDPRGLGQGLYVAKAVAEAHNGYVAVTSTPGQGSTFTLALPLSPTTE
jgi:two-component system phosphate regulon sensor histidine kinase PhoR